jgi:hypothetical protein
MGMREILFRGKQTDKDKWVFGVPANGTVADESKILIIESIFKCDEYACRGCEFTPVIPETVGQYTGKELNGVKLFDGDILEGYEDYDDSFGYPVTSYFKSVVYWDKENYCWALTTDGFIQSFNDCTWDYYTKIGNIHDNPELLNR